VVVRFLIKTLLFIFIAIGIIVGCGGGGNGNGDEESALPSKVLCEELVGPLPGPLPDGVVAAEVTSAEVAPAGTPDQFDRPQPEHCNVLGTIDAAVSESCPAIVGQSDQCLIGFRIKLPLKTAWNEKYLMTGEGGFAGDRNNFGDDFLTNNGVPALNRGYAVGASDSGHEANLGETFWALDTPPSPGIDNEREINFAFRAIHLTALVEKEIIQRFQGKPIKKSYFVGHSSGGRQGLMEAALFPDDFDGIISSAPVVNSGFVARFIQSSQAQFPDAISLANLDAVLKADDFDIIRDAVLMKCDVADEDGDGIPETVAGDGFLNDPRFCEFDIEDLDGVLTETQQEVFKTILASLKVGNGENEIFTNGFEVTRLTSEATLWFGPLNPSTPSLHFAFGTEIYKFFIKDDPNLKLHDIVLNFDDISKIFPFIAPNDLDSFVERGGKLIIFHGWEDADISPRDTIDFYETVTEKMSDEERDDHIRLFMVPGMGHITGIFIQLPQGVADFLTALENWVENGVAPDAIKATSPNNTMVRPLCPFPQRAELINPGLPEPNFENFECVDPKL